MAAKSSQGQSAVLLALLLLNSSLLNLLQVGCTVAADHKVKIGVFIESLCPDSKRFFNNQLEPTFKEIGQIIEPTIVPFGHARILGNNKMICQHGWRECEGNRQMACILARAKTMSESIETISCIFERAETPRDCISKYMPNASFDDIEKCKSSDESYQMMNVAANQTGQVDYVPHLTYNGEHSEEIQTEMENNLKDFVCKKCNGTKPAACGAPVKPDPTTTLDPFVN